jgi:uncharacterized protein (DUF427 family)
MANMTDKPKLQPGPDHPITVEANPRRVVVTVGGTKIADTTAALTLRESTYPAVSYVPRADVDMSLLERTEHTSYCPYKGDASYYSIKADGRSLDNAVWTYEQPYDSVATIRDHLAFYPDRVELTEEA